MQIYIVYNGHQRCGLIVPGEIISREVINGIKWYIENGIPVQGIMDGKIPVLQGDETWES